MLLILNRKEELLAVLDNHSQDGCPYYNAHYKEQLNNASYLEFDIPMGYEQAKHIKEENYVLFKNNFNEWQLYIIKEIEEIHEGEAIKSVYCEHASQELSDVVILDELNTTTAYDYLTQMLTGTKWEVGNVWAYNPIELLNPVQYKSILAGIHEIINAYKECEVGYRFEVVGNKIVHRYIDLQMQIGRDLGKRFEYSKDISSIRRTIDTTEIKTGIIGLGKEIVETDAEGNEVQTDIKLTFANAEWLKSNGKYEDKPLGQLWMADTAATQKWGIADSNGTMTPRFTVVEFPEIDNPSDLLEQSWLQLQKMKEPKVTYEVDAIDLYLLTKDSSISHETVRIGDVVTVIDKSFNPELRVLSRVIEIDRDLAAPENTKIILGNFKNTLVSKNTSPSWVAKSRILIGQIANIAIQLATQGTRITDAAQLAEDASSWASTAKTAADAANLKLSNFGGRNYIPNSNFKNGLAEWTKYTAYEEVVTVTDLPAFDTSMHVVSRWKGNWGVRRDVPSPNAFLNKKATFSAFIKAANIIPGTASYEKGRVVIHYKYKNSAGVEVWKYGTGKYFDSSSSSWARLSDSYVFDGDGQAVEITAISVRLYLENCQGEFWATGAKLELGDVLTDWTPSTYENPALESKVATVEATANNAASTASAAQTAAGNAVSTASTAQTTANDASSAAGAAQTTASNAASAASAAQTSANNAASAASTAQTTANNAASAASTADGKATTALDKTSLKQPIGNGLYSHIQATNQAGWNGTSGYVYLTETEGLWIYDKPAVGNPTKAVAIKGGKLGIATYDTQLQQWTITTFIDGNSVNASCINAGTMIADRIRGGMLALGGTASTGQGGQLIIYDANNVPVTQLTGSSEDTLGQIRVSKVIGADNLLYPTHPEHPDLRLNWVQNNSHIGGGSFYIYVNPRHPNSSDVYVSSTGKGAGTKWMPLKTIQAAVNRIPKLLMHDVHIRVFPTFYDGNLDINGFMGQGTLYVYGFLPGVKQIRDWIAGSSANGGNHWTELQAWDKAGNNVAVGKTQIWSTGHVMNNSGSINNNVISTTDYAYFSSTADNVKVYMGLDFGATPIDLAKLKVWHFYNDGRKYKNKTTEVYTDENRWLTVWDDTTFESTYFSYAEDAKGWTFMPYLLGYVSIKNSKAVDISDMYIDRYMGGVDQFPVTVFNSDMVWLTGCTIFTNTNYSVDVRHSNIRILQCEMSGSPTSPAFAAVSGFQNSGVIIRECSGSGNARYAAYCNESTDVTYVSTTPVATTAQSFVSDGGEVRGTATQLAGKFSDSPMKAKGVTRVTETYSAVDCDSWSETYSYWLAEDPRSARQGQWSTSPHGRHQGLWFFGTALSSAISGKTIQSIRVWIERANSSGSSAATTHYIKGHAHATKPGTNPAITGNADMATLSLAWGQSGWVDIPSSYFASFSNGTYKGIGIYTSATSGNYSKVNNNAKIEVTYLK